MKRANVNEIMENMDDKILELKVKDLLGSDSDDQLCAVKFFQMVLSTPNPDIDRVLKLNILPRVVELMKIRKEQTFLKYACWMLTNVATTANTDGTDAIVRVNGVDALLEVFEGCDFYDVKIQALWALTNIIQDSSSTRNKLISIGILPQIETLLTEIPEDGYDWIQIVLWSMTNLLNCRYYPQLTNSAIKSCLQTFLDYFSSSNETVRFEALKGINVVSENKNFTLDIIEERIIPDLLNLINGEKKSFRKAALRVVGNIAYTCATSLLIEYNVLDTLKRLLWAPDDNIIKEACWILSNISADMHIKELFDANIFPRILELLNHKDRKIRRESTWVVANTCKNANYCQIKELVIMEVIRPLTNLLVESEDSEVVATACEVIFMILNKGQNVNQDVNLFAILVDKYGGEKEREEKNNEKILRNEVRILQFI